MSPILFYQATEVQKRMPCFDVDPDRLQGIHCISAGKPLTFVYRLEVLSKFSKRLLNAMVAELVDITGQILSTWIAVQSEHGVVKFNTNLIDRSTFEFIS